MLKIQQNEVLMKKYLNVLKNCLLFDGIKDEELISVLNCLKAEIKEYKKGETVFSEGDKAKYLGVVLDGEIQIERLDYYGNKNIVANIEASQIFGESFAFAQTEALPIDVVARLNSTVMLIDAKRITSPCAKPCSYHNQLIFNLLKEVAKKNLVFHQKIEITSKRTTREKLMTFLLLQAKKMGQSNFTIPFDRQGLADYLEVDRSGLSAEISKLKKEKIIDCHKNKFTIL